MRQDAVGDTVNGIEKQLNTPPQVQNHLQNVQIINKELYETPRNRLP